MDTEGNADVRQKDAGDEAAARENSTAASFLPCSLLERLRGDSPDSPAEAQMEGSVLCVDICGFTALTERLSREGDEGVERLSRILNASFSCYIERVNARGGEVFHFAGDSLLAWWPGDETSLVRATQSAARCALDLQGIERTDPEFTPELHIGVGAGDLWAARVGGGQHRWELLLQGQAVRQAGRAETVARTGEIVCSPRALQLLSPSARAGPVKEDGYCLLRHVDPGEDLAAPSRRPPPDMDSYLVRAVRQRRDSAHHRWHAELRRLCTVFVLIHDLNERSANALERHQAAMSVLQETFRGASVDKMAMEDKGLVFATAFGTPLNTHVDDPVRAVDTAMAVKKRLADIDLQSAIGLSMGRAFCGPVGHKDRREFMMVGNAMNTAARLMISVGKGIMCCGSVADATHRRIKYRDSEELSLKGLTEPVLGFVPLSRLRRTLTPTPLVGRQQEQRQIQQALDVYLGGDDVVITIEGEPGLGKSRLIGDLVGRARRQGCDVAVGEADSVERTTSFLAWRGVFEALLGGDTESTPLELRETLLDRLMGQQRLLDLAPLLNAIVPLAIPETEITRHLGGEGRADAVLRYASDLLSHLADGPQVIVLEDCHWLDSASWRLAETVMQSNPGLLLVICTRPIASPPAEYQALKQRTGGRYILLGPLAEAAIGRLAADRLGDGMVDEQLTHLVYERTRGNPLFAEEFVGLLRETGRVELRDEQWHLNASDEDLSEIPDTIQGLITDRVDHLDSIQQLALKTASVIGRTFTMKLLRDVFPMTEDLDRLEESLESLANLRLVVPDDDGPDGFAFYHATTRDVVYGLMLHEHRETLHEAVARWFETEYSEDLSRHCAVLAFHWSRAGDDRRTLKYFDLAADHALQVGSYREADRFLERCLDLDALVHGPDRSSAPSILWQRKLAEAATGLGDISRCGTHAEQALALWGRPVSSSRVLLVLTLVWLFVCLFVRKWSSGRIAERAATEERHLELARIYGRATTAYFFNNRALELAYTSLKAAEHAERWGPSAELARAHAELGGCVGFAGLEGTARHYEARAQETAEAIGDLAAIGYVHMINALYLVGIGDWEQTRESLDRCQEVCGRLGDHVTWSNAQAIRFWLHHYKGDSDQGEAIAGRLMSRAQITGNVQHEGWALRCLAVVRLRGGDNVEAERMLEQTLEQLDASYDRTEAIPTWGALAVARLRLDDTTGAVAAARECLDLITAVARPVGHVTLEGYSGAAEVLLAAREAAIRGSSPARELMTLSRHAVQQLGKYRKVFPIGEPRYCLMSGRSLWLDGREGRAAATWRRGLAAARRLGMSGDRERLQAALEQHDLPLDEEPGG